MRIREADVLLVVDVQNDFCTNGKLPVRGGEEIVPVVNHLMRVAPHVVFTQDWHPPGHCSFGSSHPGRKPFESLRLPDGEQRLWPDHCVQGTAGAELHPGLDRDRGELILRKGFRVELDSYSAFFENDWRTPTGLGAYLRERHFARILLVGLALDICVRASAEDACRLGFETVVIEDACRAIDPIAGAAATRGALAAAGGAMAIAGEIVA